MQNININYHPTINKRIGIANTNRLGGYSHYPFDSFNIGLHVPDNQSMVLANRRLLSKAIDIDSERMVFMNQVHGSEVITINDLPFTTPTCDAMITNLTNVALCVLTADCIPIVFVDVENNAIGAAHAGWRGTVAKIAAKTIESMQQEYGSSPENMHVYLGPGIQPCCYYVGNEVYQAVMQSIPDFQEIIKPVNNQFSFDLHGANINVMKKMGVRLENIHQLTDCVCCLRDTYFSYRADKGHTGRMAMCVWIKD